MKLALWGKTFSCLIVNGQKVMTSAQKDDIFHTYALETEVVS
jgi:hypothetical protein